MKFSFEIIPFKKKKNKRSLFMFRKFFFGLKKLSIFNPEFFSVTFSKIFNFRQTLITCFFIKKCGFKVIPHFPCSLSLKNINKYINILSNNRIFTLFPLRGNKVNNFFKYSIKLINFIEKKNINFNFFSSGYPEGHPEEKKYKRSIEILKKKCSITLGIFTQFFLGFDIYYFFIKKIIEKKFLPKIYIGVMIINNIEYLHKMSKICSYSIPFFLKKIFKKNEDYIEYLIFFIKSIIEYYKPYCLHIYTMNKFNYSENFINKI
ncbi:methylenetetrahydrofolate reductase [Candidatus Vidania fulgoroideae]|nr:methylenetetrahydrofolate reductase [Candidatus Vidania fulgoroideae]